MDAASANGASMQATAEQKPPRDRGDAEEYDDEGTASEAGSRRDDGEQDDGGDDQDDDEKSAADDDDVEMEELYACPLTVRFTQEKIHPFFYRRGPIVNVVPKIRLVVQPPGDRATASWIPGDPGNDSEVYELIPPFGPIHCLRKGDELWSLDNRRLYALQLAAMEQWPARCRVKIMCSDRLPRRKLKTQWRKFQTTSEGRAITVTARFQQFDTWSWFDRAVELEMYTFSTRLGTMLNVFELLPVVGALLFRTGLTGFRTRVPFVVGFALTFGIDFARQKVLSFEKRICEAHVKCVMDGDQRAFAICCQRREAGESAMSAPQLAACMVIALLLLLPYVQSIAHEKLRSSFFSCWLGIACVLAVQSGMILRTKRVAEIEYGGTDNKLTPKHRT